MDSYNPDLADNTTGSCDLTISFRQISEAGTSLALASSAIARAAEVEGHTVA